MGSFAGLYADSLLACPFFVQASSFNLEQPESVVRQTPTKYSNDLGAHPCSRWMAVSWSLPRAVRQCLSVSPQFSRSQLCDLKLTIFHFSFLAAISLSFGPVTLSLMLCRSEAMSHTVTLPPCAVPTSCHDTFSLHKLCRPHCLCRPPLFCATSLSRWSSFLCAIPLAHGCSLYRTRHLPVRFSHRSYFIRTIPRSSNQHSIIQDFITLLLSNLSRRIQVSSICSLRYSPLVIPCALVSQLPRELNNDAARLPSISPL